MSYKSLFSYYGGKGAISHLYPHPTYDLIIEPFAGAANYSMRYCDHQVLLYDTDPILASIWNFLLSPDALDYCLKHIPPTIDIGALVTEIVPTDAPSGYLRLLQSYANVGTQGAKGIHNQVTKLGADGWGRIRSKLEYFLPRIQHWHFIESAYNTIPNDTATWFIDPPYNNPAGQRYRQSEIDYHRLGGWARQRNGQVIVCENEGAGWLPFKPLVSRRGVKSSYQKSNAMEVIWTNG